MSDECPEYLAMKSPGTVGDAGGRPRVAHLDHDPSTVQALTHRAAVGHRLPQHNITRPSISGIGSQRYTHVLPYEVILRTQPWLTRTAEE
jgi:hypothetical protein